MRCSESRFGIGIAIDAPRGRRVSRSGGIGSLAVSMRMKAIVTLLTALVSTFAGGCGKHADAPASATISWIHPRLSQPTQPVGITNSSAVALLPSLFEGYDGPPPNVPAADPPMYDCIITMTSREGAHT